MPDPLICLFAALIICILIGTGIFAYFFTVLMLEIFDRIFPDTGNSYESDD